jgi:protein-S-isoprenylcysteine O-methyltransferase Ste14
VAKFEYRHEDSAAASARNWWRVLLVDALVGVILLALGVASIVAWNGIVGWILVLLGVAYLLALVGRYRAWRAHRARAGLDG